MAKVALKDWKEQIRDPKIECMSRDEMTALQSERLVKQVKNVYDHVEFYRKKMDDMGIEPGDIKGIEDIGKLPFTTKEDLRANYPFGLLAVPQEKIVRTYCRGSSAYLLWIWLVYRRNGTGFRSKKAWSNGYSDVSR